MAALLPITTGASLDDADLTEKLSRYSRAADRRQALRTLMDPKLLPRMQPLRSVWVEDIAAAEREAAGERASLNGVKFLQVKNVNNGEYSCLRWTLCCWLLGYIIL